MGMTFPNLTPDEIEASFRDWWKDRYGSESEPFNAVIEWTQFALARHGCTALQPQQEGVEPTDAGLDALERKHWKLDSVVEYEPGLGCREVLERQETFDHRAFARTVLTRYGRPTFQPIPVSERLPGPEDCCPNPRTGLGRWCWGWVQRDPIPYSGCWRMMRREWLSAEALAWAPWWAFPLPGSDSPGATEIQCDRSSDGLLRKYIVLKADKTPSDPNAEYFVLRLDDGGKDPRQIEACRVAVREYARQIAVYLPALSADLLSKYPPNVAIKPTPGAKEMAGEGQP